MEPEPSSGFRSAVETVRPTLVTYLVLVLLVLVPVLVLLTPYVVSLASGLVLAVLCQPVYSRIRRRLPPMGAGVLVTLAAALLVLAPLTLVVAGGIRQASIVLAQSQATDAPSAREIADTLRRWVPLRAHRTMRSPSHARLGKTV